METYPFLECKFRCQTLAPVVLGHELCVFNRYHRQWKGSKKYGGKVWSFAKPPSDPHFFFQNKTLLGDTNFTLGPISKSILSPRIWDVRATFKAVLTAVDMKYALQTKCKTCFGGPRMILDTL